MPAAERELIFALFEVASKSSIANVLLVVPVHSDESSSLVAQLQEKEVKVSVVVSLKGLQNAPRGAYDAIIANKLIVTDQLIDEPSDLDAFVNSALNALKDGGILIVREDLEGHFATEKVAQFTRFFDLFRTSADNTTIGFEFCSLKQVNATVHTRRNFLDVFWTLRKKHFEMPRLNQKAKTFRDFLDTTQYTDEGIRAYEWIFGENFISPGGYNENLLVLKRLGELKPDSRMLDIGVGIGGGARQAAKEFGLLVLGIDISANMLSIAMDRLQVEKDTRIRYQICNAVDYQFPSNSFDYIVSRDGLHHNEHIDIVMKNIFKWLKPGGKALITIYGKGHGAPKTKFQAYVENRKYHLKTLEQMVQVTKDAGFENVQGTNLTKRLRDILIEERTRALARKGRFLEDFSEETFNSLLEGWNDKIDFIDDDNQTWLQIIATKPL